MSYTSTAIGAHAKVPVALLTAAIFFDGMEGMTNFATSDLVRNLAANIRARRTARGISQRRLAELAGVARPTVEQIELANRAPNLETVERLAAALGTTVTSLLRAPPRARKADRRVRDVA